jgi:ABC-type branched-subunit amino acid transport system substrate-binding protein
VNGEKDMKAIPSALAAMFMLVAFASPACAPQPIAFPSEVPIGCLMAASSAPAWGPNLIKAVQVGVEEVNSHGGIDGKPLKLVVEDEGMAPSSSLNAARKLVEQAGVRAIIGATTSEDVMAVGPYVAGKEVLLVSPSATSSSLAKQGWSRWVFRVSPGDALQGGVVAKLIKDNGYKRVAMLVQDSVYGKGIEETTREFLKGRADVVTSVRYDPEKMSYRAELNSIKDKNPDCVLHAGYYDDGAVVFEQALALGMDNIPWVAVDGVYDMPLDKYPDAAKFMEKAVTGTVPLPDLQSQAYQTFASRYKVLYGYEPTIYCDTAYDGLSLVGAAMRRSKVYSGAAFRDAMAAVGSNYEGASGTITFGGSGERMAGIYGVWKVESKSGQDSFVISGQPVNFLSPVR